MTTNSSASTGPAMGLTCCMGPDWPYTPWGAPLDENIDVDWKEVQRFFHSLPKMHQLIVVHATYLTGPHTAVGTAYSTDHPDGLVELVSRCISEGAVKLSSVFAVPRLKRGYKAVTGICGDPFDKPTFAFWTRGHSYVTKACVFDQSVDVRNKRLVNLLETLDCEDLTVDQHVLYQCRVPLPGIRGFVFDSDRKDRPLHSFENFELASYRKTVRWLESQLAEADEAAA